MDILTRGGLLVRAEGEIPLYRTTEKGETALGHLRRARGWCGVLKAYDIYYAGMG